MEFCPHLVALFVPAPPGPDAAGGACLPEVPHRGNPPGAPDTTPGTGEQTRPDANPTRSVPRTRKTMILKEGFAREPGERRQRSAPLSIRGNSRTTGRATRRL